MTSEKARARADMEQEQSKRDRTSEQKQKQRDTALGTKEKESDRGRSDVYRESLVETRTTPGSLSETLQTTALPSSCTTVPHPQYLAIAPTLISKCSQVCYYSVLSVSQNPTTLSLQSQ